MDKWADYLISQVSYDLDHLITVAIRHQDTENGITTGKPIDRLTIASDIKNGLTYITIYSGKDSWKKGHKIQTFSVDGNPYLRIDGNKVKLDYLGDLPNVLVVTQKELPQELDLVPEQTEESPSNPRGSLPKQSTEELPQELDLVPEPIVESDEATPEQIAQLNELQDQINDLEEILAIKLSSNLNKSKKEKSKKNSNKQKIKTFDVKKKIIPRLEKQNKKLNTIEKKLHTTITSKNDITENSYPDAYCFKCKTKRKIKNPQETTMKNGRAAIKGICSECGCKVFRIGKIKK